MKIIKETDNRYKLLPELWRRLNSGELKIIQRSPGGGVQYCIPKELVIHEFSRTTGRGNIISASKTEDSYIITYRFESILFESCELTKQEYYDILFLLTNDTDDRPKCCICGTALKFSGKMLQGYHQGGGFNEDSKYTCSASCKSSMVLIDGWKAGKFDDSTDKRGFSVGWKKDYSKMYESVHSILKEAENSRTRFISTSNGRHSYFYIMIIDSELKIGISSHDPGNRIENVSKQYFDGRLSSRTLIYEGGNIEVADTEYDIKILLYNLGISPSTRCSEIFPYSDKLLSIIESKIKERLSLYNS